MAELPQHGTAEQSADGQVWPDGNGRAYKNGASGQRPL